MRVGVEAWGLSGDMRNTGMGEYTARLLLGLAGVDGVDVFAYCGPEERRPEWLPDSVRWRPVGAPLPHKLTALASRSVPLNHSLRRDGIDVYHCASVHWRPQFPQVPRPPCALVVTLHDLIVQTYYDPRDLPLRQRVFARWNLGRAMRADRILTVSHHAKADIVRYTGCEPDRVRVIHNAVDFAPNPDRTALAELGIGAPYILYAGSYEPRKNLARAAEAYARLVGAGSPLELVAVVERQSGHAAEVLKRIEETGVAARVHLVHSLPSTTLRSLYTHAEVVLFPSLAEGFGYPPLQAAACAVPAVVSDLPPLRETLREWPIFVDPLSVDDIAAGLQRALTDGAARGEMARRGPGLAAEYSVARSVGRHVDAYQETLAAGWSPAST